MRFEIKKYYSGFCSYEIEASNEEQAYEMLKEMPINYDEILETLEAWEECDETESIGSA